MRTNKLIYQFQNTFGAFSVEELDYDGRSARVLFSGPLHAAQSGIALDSDPRMLFDYNQRFLELATQLNPEHILVLGGGMLTLPLALTSCLSKVRVTAVEINPDFIELAAKYFGYQPQRRLQVIVEDASKFLKNDRSSYDLIMIDLFNELTIPEKFLSVDFSFKLKRAISAGGVIAVNCISACGKNALPLKKLTDTFSSTIGPVRALKASNKYPDFLPQNLIVLSGGSTDHLLPGLSEVG